MATALPRNNGYEPGGRGNRAIWWVLLLVILAPFLKNLVETARANGLLEWAEGVIPAVPVTPHSQISQGEGNGMGAPTTMNDPADPGLLRHAQASISPDADLVPVQVSWGLYQQYFTTPAVAEFRVVTPPGEEFFFLKLVDATSGAPIMSFFVPPNTDYGIHVPLGRFRLAYTWGKTWYGDVHLFGRTSQVVMSDRPLEFYVGQHQTGQTYYMGHTVHLRGSVNGNFPVSAIPRDQF